MAQNSDVSLKYLFRYSKGILADMLFGPGPREFLNVELPQITNRRIDTVTRCADGMLRHAEFEGENRPNTQRRFTEYYLALHRLFDEHEATDTLPHKTVGGLDRKEKASDAAGLQDPGLDLSLPGPQYPRL